MNDAGGRERIAISDLLRQKKRVGQKAAKLTSGPRKAKVLAIIA